MQVKIGDKIYNSEDQPIMVILTDIDQEIITSMTKYDRRYTSFPTGFGGNDEMLRWMEGEEITDEDDEN